MIKLINVSYGYNKEKLFNNINLTIKNPGLTLIYGDNGIGKTTLINLISKIIKPTSGKVIGNDVINVNYKGNLLSGYNVFNNIKLICKLNKRKINYSKLNYYFNYLKVNDLYESNIDELSSGQKQRIYLILALILNKKHIVLDEITSNLDKENKLLILSLLKKEANKKIIILVSHDLDCVPFSNNIIKIKDKQLSINSFNFNKKIVENKKSQCNIYILFKILLGKKLIFKKMIYYLLVSTIISILSINYNNFNNKQLVIATFLALLSYNYLFEYFKNIKNDIVSVVYLSTKKTDVIKVYLIKCIIDSFVISIGTYFINSNLVSVLNDININVSSTYIISGFFLLSSSINIIIYSYFLVNILYRKISGIK